MFILYIDSAILLNWHKEKPQTNGELDSCLHSVIRYPRFDEYKDIFMHGHKAKGYVTMFNDKGNYDRIIK